MHKGESWKLFCNLRANGNAVYNIRGLITKAQFCRKIFKWQYYYCNNNSIQYDSRISFSNALKCVWCDPCFLVYGRV